MTVAHSAQFVLSAGARLVNHRTSTRTADVVGWKEDGLAMVKGIDTDVPFGSRDNCRDIWASS